MRNEWRKIRSRYDALQQMRLDQSGRQGSNDSLIVIAGIGQESLLQIQDRLAQFRNTYVGQLDARAQEALKQAEELIASECQHFGTAWPRTVSRYVRVLTELSILFFDIEESLFSDQREFDKRTLRAFLHTNRRIETEPEYRKLWRDAFGVSRAEEACERLGAVALLSHGLFAFKVSAEGQRTDLLVTARGGFDERLATQTADAIILTEWKIAEQGNVQTQIARALTQAKLYEQGALGGVELRRVRYLVMVSETGLVLPNEQITEGEKVYRVVNIVVAPLSPSKQAKRNPAPLPE